MSMRILAALGATAVLSVVWPSPAGAQTPSIPPPAPNQITDSNGVNLYSGQISVSTTEIAIGPEEGGLRYHAIWDTGVNEWRHSVAGMVTREPFSGPGSDYPWYTATVMGTSVGFLLIAGEYEAQDGDGMLAETGGVYTYTALDGTTATFAGGRALQPYLANEGLISTITRPNGDVISFTYTPIDTQVVRLQSVTNNFGYQLHFEYESATSGVEPIRVTALNNAIDACAPTANTCTFSRSWPSLTFSETGNQRAVADNLGRTLRLTFGSGRLIGVSRPTQTSGDVTP